MKLEFIRFEMVRLSKNELISPGGISICHFGCYFYWSKRINQSLGNVGGEGACGLFAFLWFDKVKRPW